MRRKGIAVVITLLCAALSVGCGSQKASVKSSEVDTANVLTDNEILEQQSDLKDWKGEWTSFTHYCNDEKLDNIWNSIAETHNLDKEKLEDTFKTMTYLPDDIKNFKIEDNVITGYAEDGTEVFSHKYEYVKTLLEDSDKTVISGQKSYLFKSLDEDSGLYNYFCIMKLCDEEKDDRNSSISMADHFHFSYGTSEDDIKDFVGIPTMIDSNISDAEKVNSMMIFFGFNSGR